jgi:hypothetical protein
MPEIVIEQGRSRRVDNGSPAVQARSSGFADAWLPPTESILVKFGIRIPGLLAQPAIFAQPLGDSHVCAVRVAEDSEGLNYHVLVCRRGDYEANLGDPFTLARQFSADGAQSTSLPAVTLPVQAVLPRTVSQVQGVLRRVKAGALKENEDPEKADFQHTLDNSESPALLGGVQVLVDGGKLVFERPGPDPQLVEGLWMLLPQSTRARLWPATFAFSNALGFDVMVTSKIHVADFEGYTSEDQAAEYPAGHYEMALQVAAESGDQRDLDALLNRRSSRETFKLGWTLLIVVIILVLTPKVLDFFGPRPVSLETKEQVAATAAMVTAGDPWTVLGIRISGHILWKGK